MTSETGFVKNRDASSSGRFESRHRQLGRKSRRVYLKASLLLFLALAAGVAIGVGGTLYFIKNRLHRKQPKAEQIGQTVLERLGEAVVLSGDERARLEQIISVHMGEVEKVRKESLSAISREFDNMNDKVDEILGPERSDKWEAEKKKRYGKFYRSRQDRHSQGSRRAGSPKPPGAGGNAGEAKTRNIAGK